MDKYEYKLRLEEIKTLNRKGRFQEAAQVADTVDWKKVRNVSTLGIISDVYKVNRRFEDAKAILLLAKEQSPQNRRILYSLCDLTIKMGQVVEAVEYYKEYVQMAPNDSSKYILLYKIYEAQDISLDERIAVLKEYKKREYNEKWAYELASLYHRCGYATECVEECDQLILWFGEGKYVAKAMELKMRYVPLSPAQKQIYDRMYGRLPEQEEEQSGVKAEHQTAPEPAKEAPTPEEIDIQVKTMDMSKYNTLNLQAALAESMREVMEPGQSAYGGDNAEYQDDVSKVMEDSADWDVQATGQMEEPQTEQEAMKNPEEWNAPEEAGLPEKINVPEDAGAPGEGYTAERINEPGMENAPERGSAPGRRNDSGRRNDPERTEARKENRMDALLRQEYDGQISLALPEERPVEKQITGQMSIQDVLAEWENLKKKNEEKRRQETRQWVQQQTGSLFADFDQLSRDGILERLQREESLPLEDVQRTSAGRPEMLSEMEELEDAEAVETLADTEAVSMQKAAQPAPANAAARAVMAAQGIMEEAPITKMQETESKEQQETESELSEENQKRLTIETLIREAEAKQREAQALLMELEKERLGLSGQPGEQPQPDSQAAVQPESSAAVQPESSAAAQSEPQATAQSESQAAMQPESQAAAGAESSVVAQTEPQAAMQPESSAAVQTGTAENTADVAKNAQALNDRIQEQQLEEHERNMTRDEKELFSPFVPTKGAMRQLVKALDEISLSAYTGNMIITGAPGSDMMKLAKSVVKKMRASDRNFSGKLARISGDVLNTRNVGDIVAKLPNGALIIEKGGSLSDQGAANLAKALNQEQIGIIVFLLDSRKAIAGLMERCPQLAESFTARFDIASLDTGTLVKYGCQYAYNMEFSIDELGRLALHTRIEDLQTRDHAVTVEEVREIIEEAISHAERFSIRHFLDILFRRRYDEDDMIILKERDFT